MKARALGDVLLHPLAWVAMAALVINDHWAKAAFHNVVTGKVSDFAGLAFFPLLLVAALEIVTRRSSTRGSVVACVAATGVVFTLVETWAPASCCYESVLGAARALPIALVALAHGDALPQVHRVLHVADTEDLIALPALALPLRVAWMRAATSSRAPVPHTAPTMRSDTITLAS